MEEYSKTRHAETSSSAMDSHLSQLSTDLRSARTASEHYAVHKSESDRLSNAASYVRQHSGQIDSNLNQEIANHTVRSLGRKEAEELFAGKNRPKLEAVARDYIRTSGIESSIISRYQNSSYGVNHENKYQSGQIKIKSRKESIGDGYETQIQNMNTKKPEFNQQQFRKIQDETEKKYENFIDEVKEVKDIKNEYSKMRDNVANNIEEGESRSKSSAFNMKDSIRPRFLNQDKDEKNK